jgi:hypothetical protein
MTVNPTRQQRMTWKLLASPMWQSLLLLSLASILVEGWVSPTILMSSKLSHFKSLPKMSMPSPAPASLLLLLSMRQTKDETEDDRHLSSTSSRGVSRSSSSSSSPMASRRHVLRQTLCMVVVGSYLLSVGGILTLSPSKALAASSARVATWPSIEYLEPLYELKLSVQALAQATASSDMSKFGMVQQRLEKLFSGGIFSERNYYIGLGATYMEQIRYDKNELKEYIQLDKEARFQAMEDTMNSLQDLLNALKKSSSANENAAAVVVEVQQCANGAKVSLDRWFALVPADDVSRAGQLFLNTRTADVNRNGKLEPDELATLSEDDRILWKKRVAFVGE